MMQFGLNTAGPDSPRGLTLWVIKHTKTDSTDTYTPVPFQSSQGNDRRGIMGLGVMRSLVDSAAAITQTKYEKTLATIHDNLESQATRDDAIQDIEQAIRESARDGDRFLAANWPTILKHLHQNHPLNPRITDAANAIEHLGGMQLHLTSRKKRHIQHDTDHEYEEIAHNDAQDQDIAMMHMHTKDTYLKKFIAFVVNATNCIYQVDKTKKVAIPEPPTATATASPSPTSSPTGTATTPAAAAATPTATPTTPEPPDSTTHSEPQQFYIECSPQDCGLAENTNNVNENHILFATPDDGPPQWFKQDSDHKHKFIQTDPPTSATPTVVHLSKEHHISKCMTDIVIPASMAPRLLTGAYPAAVDKVRRAMEHVEGFAANDPIATAIAQKVRETLTQQLQAKPWDILCLTPSAHGATPDFTLDLDQPNGWAIGFSPSEHTDAAEAAQAFLSQALFKAENTHTTPEAESITVNS